MMIFPFILITFLRLEFVLSTSNYSSISGYASGMIDNCGKNNLQNLLGTLTSQTKSTGFYNFSTTSPGTPNQLHGLYLCRGDVIDLQDCYSCINSVKNYVFENSFYGKEGLVWYNHCMVRYSNESFLGKLDTNMLSSSWTSLVAGEKGYCIHYFMKILRNTMKALAIQASSSGNKFASMDVKYTRFDSLHAMVQCTPDLLASECYRCLASASQKLLGFCGSISGKVIYRSCMVQYKTTSEEVKPLHVLPSIVKATNSAPISLTGTQIDSADRTE